MQGEIDKFRLVVAAAYRAKEMARGAPPFVDVVPGEKFPTIALREIREGAVNIEKIEKMIMRSQQSYDAQKKIFEVKRHGYDSVEDEVYDLFLESLEENIDADGKAMETTVMLEDFAVDALSISGRKDKEAHASIKKNLYEDVSLADGEK